MKPLISVIVPVYNGQDYLENCIACIDAQTYENIEIVLVDDGSSDNTPVICKRLFEVYQAKEKDVQAGEKRRSLKRLTLGDEGVSAARNKALAQASGDFVAFVDADDRILPDMLCTLYNVQEEYSADVTGCSFFCFSDEASYKANVKETAEQKNGEVKCYTGKQFKEQEILAGNTRCWSKLYKKSVLENISFRQGLSIGEDMLFLAELMGQAKKVCEIPYKGYGYYRNAAGAMNRKFTLSAMDQITCWELAGEVIGQSAALSKIILESILLTAGRIAALHKEERQKYEKQIEICLEKMKSYAAKDAVALLSKGYKVKLLMFRSFPHLYMALYHYWKQ